MASFTEETPPPRLNNLPGQWLQCQANGSNVCRVLRKERLVFYCQTTSASTAPRTPRRTCCPYAYVLITVLRVSRSCEHFPDGFDLHLLRSSERITPRRHSRRRSLSLMLSDTRVYEPHRITLRRHGRRRLFLPTPAAVPRRARI